MQDEMEARAVLETVTRDWFRNLPVSSFSGDALSVASITPQQATDFADHIFAFANRQRERDGEAAEDIIEWFDLEWTGAPRPPVHPNPMTGRRTFDTFEKAIAFFLRQPSDATFVSLHSRQIYRRDRTNQALAALTDPASRIGGA